MVVVEIIGNTEISGMVRVASPWTSKLKFGILDKMIIKYSDPKDYLRSSGKELITFPGIKTNVRPNKKSQGIPLLISVQRIFQRLSRSLETTL